MGYGRYFKLVHGGLPYGNPRELWNIAILIAIFSKYIAKSST